MPNLYCVFGGEPIESPGGESLEGVGETRLSTGTIFTDKLFTGQREMAGLGIYHYNARFYSPKLGRFLSHDTIVPGYTNPQNLNRFNYVTNNPLRYTDPTGHMFTDEGGGGCSPCTQLPQKSKDEPKKDKDNDDCRTVSCRAFKGDLLAIADLLIPTHIGWRFQAEGSVTLGAAAGPGGSGTVGFNIGFNRKSNEFGLFVDWSLEGGGGVGPLLGASGTTGPIVGWGSSTLKDVAVGDSYIISGTASYEAAGSVALSVPRDGLKLHVDPVYGQIPPTIYGGVGIGTPYAGAGGGVSRAFGSAIIDLSPYLP